MGEFKDFFGKNAEKYAASERHKSGKDLSILISSLNLKRTDKCLDLAAGTGFTSMELAKRTRSVVAYDGTEEMLKEAEKLSMKEGIENISFTLGRVESLPFESSSFEIVTTRRAAHHFEDKQKFLRESFRVLKSGGLIGIADLVEPEEDMNGLFDRLEAIRDPSHVKAEKISQWRKLVTKAGFKISFTEELIDPTDFLKWLYPVEPESAPGKEAIEFINNCNVYELKEMDFNRDKMVLRKHRMVLVASKP